MDDALRNAGRVPDLVLSKGGRGDAVDGRGHDCAIVERTIARNRKIRYVSGGPRLEARRRLGPEADVRQTRRRDRLVALTPMAAPLGALPHGPRAPWCLALSTGARRDSGLREARRETDT